MSTGRAVALGLVAVGVVLLCAMAVGGLLVAAAVVGLAPVTGTGWALFLVASGLLVVIGVVIGAVAAAARRARVRRRAVTVPVMAVLEVALAVLPRRRVAQIEAALVAGLAVGTLLLGVLGKGRG